MRNKLRITLLITLSLVLLSSCIINIDYDPDPSGPETEKFTYTSVFKGPVKDKDGKITSYQFMCYVNNRTGSTLENVRFEIDWEDELGNLIDFDYVTIPRLERGAKWPVGVIHSSTSDITRLKNSRASIRYLSSSSDLSRYSVRMVVFDKEVYHYTDAPSEVSGCVKNNNTFDILDPKVYVVSETSSGIIAEYGMTEGSGILTPNLNYYHFDMILNSPAKTPAKGRTYYYVVGTRR